MLLINKFDASRPLDARVGEDPFDLTDLTYKCDGDHHNQQCFIDVGACVPDLTKTRKCLTIPVLPVSYDKHNELLGGHGDDVINGGPNGDVLWTDYKATGNNSTQKDEAHGGAGDDFIYASHGYNLITTGGGKDIVHAHFGRGDITCDSDTVLVFLSHSSSHDYHLHGCRHITFKPAGTQQA